MQESALAKEFWNTGQHLNPNPENPQSVPVTPITNPLCGMVIKGLGFGLDLELQRNRISMHPSSEKNRTGVWGGTVSAMRFSTGCSVVGRTPQENEKGTYYVLQ